MRLDRSLGFRRGGLEFLELHLQLVEQLAATFRGGAEALALQLSDQQLQMRHHRLGTGGTRLGLAPRRTFRQQRCFQRFDVVGQGIVCAAHGRSESHLPSSCTRNSSTWKKIIPPVPAARFVADFASRCLRAYSPAAPLLSKQLHPPERAR